MITFFVRDQLSPCKRNFISLGVDTVSADSGCAETAMPKSLVCFATGFSCFLIFGFGIISNYAILE